jgi:hypothetical protein
MPLRATRLALGSQRAVPPSRGAARSDMRCGWQALVGEQDQVVQGHMARALGQMVEACRPALLSPALLEETAAALKQVRPCRLAWSGLSHAAGPAPADGRRMCVPCSRCGCRMLHTAAGWANLGLQRC